MTVKELAEKLNLEIINLANNDLKISGVYCCDLLSIVMGKAFKDCAWVTVMGNINSIAVASLVEIGVIVLADGITPDENAVNKAKENNINVLVSKENIFNTALKVNNNL